MKKSLLAVAVAAALPTFAQAQSSVTMFGVLDASVEYSNANANAGVPPTTGTALPLQEGKSGLRLQSSLQSGSRFGVRGAEDLGGGLKAIFVLEHGFDVSTGDTASGNKFWNRQAYVGLESASMGTITMGRQYSPLFWALADADFAGYGFYNNWAGSSGTNTGPAGVAAAQGPIRLDNAISYKSPTFNNLTVWGTYAPGENLTNNPSSSTAPGSGTVGTGDIWGLAAGYRIGGLYISGGYHSIDRKPVSTGSVEVKSVSVVQGSYNFGNFGFSLGYSELSINQAGNALSPKVKNILVSSFANVGTGQLILDLVNQDFNDLSGLKNGSGLQMGLAYTMPLSKRTNWYVAFGKNDYAGAQAPGATVLVDNQLRTSVGLRHLF